MKTQNKTEVRQNPSMVFVLNVILLLIVGLLVLYYVVQANVMAANNYKVNLLNEKLNFLNEVRSALVAKKAEIQEPAKLLNFALSQNMVEAKNPLYIFENSDLAQK